MRLALLAAPLVVLAAPQWLQVAKLVAPPCDDMDEGAQCENLGALVDVSADGNVILACGDGPLGGDAVVFRRHDASQPYLPFRLILPAGKAANDCALYDTGAFVGHRDSYTLFTFDGQPSSFDTALGAGPATISGDGSTVIFADFSLSGEASVTMRPADAVTHSSVTLKIPSFGHGATNYPINNVAINYPGTQFVAADAHGGPQFGKAGVYSSLYSTKRGFAAELNAVNRANYYLVATNNTLSVAISADGSTLAVGEPQSSRVSLFDFSNIANDWESLANVRIVNSSAFGTAVRLSLNGSRLIVGDPTCNAPFGCAFALDQQIAASQQAVYSISGTLHALVDDFACNDSAPCAVRFGAAVALSAYGNVAVVGAPGDAGGRGAVWVFAAQPPSLAPAAQPSSAVSQAPGTAQPFPAPSTWMLAPVASQPPRGDKTPPPLRTERPNAFPPPRPSEAPSPAPSQAPSQAPSARAAANNSLAAAIAAPVVVVVCGFALAFVGVLALRRRRARKRRPAANIDFYEPLYTSPGFAPPAQFKEALDDDDDNSGGGGGGGGGGGMVRSKQLPNSHSDGLLVSRTSANPRWVSLV